MRIEALTLTGQGLAEDGSRWPRVLPGEEIDGDGRILVPSPDRVSPPCRHFKSCGGCAMQHASDDFVAGWKAGIVEKALSARGISAELETVLTSPQESRRRAKLSGRRTKKGAIVGFHGRASGTITEVPDCRVITPRLRDVLPVLEAITARSASRKGELDLTVTDSVEGVDLSVAGGPELDFAAITELTAVAQRAGLSRLTWNGEVVVTLADPVQRMGRAQVAPPPGAFLQATRQGEQALVDHVRTATTGAARVIDLFAGCGTFTLPLAETAEVHAVEGDAAMLAALDRGWRLAPGLRRVTTEARDLFRRPLMPDELGYDAAVLDPPRAGAEAQIAQVAAARVPIVEMVSCNPVTFARDVETLIGAGYALGAVTVVDQFRWSAHVELCATLTLT